MNRVTPRPVPHRSPASSRSRMLLAACGATLLVGCGRLPCTCGATVSGTVVSTGRAPLSGVTVYAGTRSAVTAADGSFSLAGVTAPYDLVLLSTGGSVVYRGLSNPAPRLVDFSRDDAPTLSAATVQGSLPGAPDARVQGVVFGSAQTPPGGSQSVVSFPAGPGYSLTARWSGASTTGTVHALRWNQSATLPTTFLGYGRREGVGLTNGAALTGQDVTLAPVGTNTYGGTVTPPTNLGSNLRAFSSWVNFGDGALLRLVSSDNFASSFSFAAPAVSGATMVTGFLATTADTASQAVLLRTGTGTAETGLNLAFNPYPVPLSPADGATGVGPGTAFSWTAFPGGVHVVRFNTSVAARNIWVVTSGTSTALPDLSAYGRALPPSVAYTWRVVGYSPNTSLDAATSPGGFLGFVGNSLGADALPDALPAAPTTFQAAEGPARTYTTAP